MYLFGGDADKRKLDMVLIIKSAKCSLILACQRNMRIKNSFVLDVFRVTGIMASDLLRRKGKF